MRSLSVPVFIVYFMHILSECSGVPSAGIIWQPEEVSHCVTEDYMMKHSSLLYKLHRKHLKS